MIELGLDFLGPVASQVVALNFDRCFDVMFHGQIMGEMESDVKGEGQHGGISLEEMILPVGILKPKR